MIELRIAYRLPDAQHYVDAYGRLVAEPGLTPGRVLTVLVRDGRRIAVVSHTAALPDLERAIGAAVRLALENERLQAEVLAQLTDLRASRVRISETGDAERRRLERPARWRPAATVGPLVRHPAGTRRRTSRLRHPD